ncbi:ABC transporter permease [Oscillochloris sp. ZM17-4]|uniref:ABC transporter permease n=1 Tax=Oscillochloris sp. ZM17-4 TaxID=2866714 RepID=UPI001C72A840|nr:FtsX-like permease family protein [Oscillochloris sp. ZM17-4]MBX0329472.1 ABC transporter permease [Oscillochloris sp. ZM17-4]
MLSKLWVLAYRDLWRNRRRTILSMTAVALGLGLLIVMNGYIAGVMDEAVQNNIRLNTGHLQIRASSYNVADMSLQWKDLISDSDQIAARAAALPGVRAAAPVLWAGGLIATVNDSVGLQISGIDTTSAFYAPIRDSVVAGDFLAADDRSGILIGERLANSLGIGVGRDVSLTIVDSDGQADEGIFTVRGLFRSGIPSYDEGTVLMPISKAQAFARADGRASSIIILLDSQEATDSVAAALQTPGTQTLTWRDLNQTFLQTMEAGLAFYYILDLIVILIVAVIIANTLLMSVFERIREMGILAALGMKGRHLTQMLLLEAATLGLVGVGVGLALGLGGVAYLTYVGIYIGDIASAAGSGVALSSTIHARFVPGTFAGISLATLVIVMLSALYPAWYAAHLEPVAALRG